MTAQPELPEVEAIRRVLEPQIRGLEIEQAAVSRPKWSRILPLINFAAVWKDRFLIVSHAGGNSFLSGLKVERGLSFI